MGSALARREGNLCWIHFMSSRWAKCDVRIVCVIISCFCSFSAFEMPEDFTPPLSPPDSMLSTTHNKTSAKFPAWTSLCMQSPVCLTVSQYQNYMFPRTAFRMCNLKWYFQELFCLQSAEPGIWAFLTNTEKTYSNKLKNFIGKGV